jgi:CubicO group peptidase (beta-lactamase class C family)
MRPPSTQHRRLPKPHAFLPRGIRLDLTIAILCVFFCLGASHPTFADQPSPTPSPSLVLDEQTRASVIEAAAKALEDKYIFLDLGKQMAAKIRDNNSSKAYDSLTTGEDLSKRLTDDLRAVAHDRHIRVNYPDPEAHDGSPTAEDQARFQQRAAWSNYAFPEIKRLAGNVGYLKVDALLPPTIAGDTANAAMTFLANTDALIIDERDGHGGDPEMVDLLLTYLFPIGDRVHLNDFEHREEPKHEEFYTFGWVPGKRLSGKDVYVLTSHNTFSGSEELAYDLKALKRATIVGEVTGGGANPGDVFPLPRSFSIFVPTGRAVNPTTKTNWEGVGLQPDVVVSADKALDMAHYLALKKLNPSPSSSDKKAKEISTKLRELEKEFPAQADLSRMEEVIQYYVNSHKFMGSILLSRNDQILLDKGYGYANLEWQVPDSADTKFRLGSITKQFTAACILLLEERGKLNTDDPVKKYLPDAPSAWDHVTIYNLLTHTSGIPSFTEFPDYQSNEAKPTTPEQLVAWFRDKPLEFQPGKDWHYSNSGYALLGYLIEKITGQRYQDFVEENIFKPLGMENSGYDSSTAVIPHRAAGYSPAPDGPVNAGYIDMSIPFSAGALYSTTHDLLRWEQALFAGELLSTESLRKMTIPFKRNYGCGLLVRTVNGLNVIDHGGGIEGFSTMLAYYPDDKLTVVVLGNLEGEAPVEIADSLAAIAHGEKVILPSERKEVSVPPDTLAKYIGTYELGPKFNITITLEGNQLMAQGTNQPKSPIFPESDTNFFSKTPDAQLEFFKNDQGQTTHLVLHQNGKDINGVKK